MFSGGSKENIGKKWVNQSSCKLTIPSDTNNIPRGFDTCKLGETNELLVSKMAPGFWKIKILIDFCLCFVYYCCLKSNPDYLIGTSDHRKN